jgi:hypothetical protein
VKPYILRIKNLLSTSGIKGEKTVGTPVIENSIAE